jgi:hypothetical protein
MMAELKTRPTDESVDRFLRAISDDQKREDCFVLLEMMGKASGTPAKMWGESIVGFGEYHYRYASGHEGDWFLAGFSPRKQNITLYIMSGFEDYNDLLKKLGKYKTGKACLYIKRLQDVDRQALEELIAHSIEHMKKTNPPV